MIIVTMENSELIDKLVFIAGGDIELVQDAIQATAAACRSGKADLEKVVDYIVSRRAHRQGAR